MPNCSKGSSGRRSITAATDLPDVNVWVALSTPDHPMRPAAARYWREASAPNFAFSRVTALGLVRVVSSPTHFGGRSLDPADAWRAYAIWRLRPEVHLFEEPPHCDSLIEEWIHKGLVTARTWTDAYLAAFALSSGFRLVTFDQDFGRFPGLDRLTLIH
ncbi:MAG: TA system VapC family ribonuclease toxin [Fimbriimonadales bacterium]